MPDSPSLNAAPKGSRENPLSLEDMPFKVEEGGRLWMRAPHGDAFQFPFSPPGSVLDVEVRFNA